MSEVNGVSGEKARGQFPDEMFVDDGPDVGVGGLSVVRVMAAPEGSITLDEDEGAPSPPLRWFVGGVPSEVLHPGLVLMGDLFVRTESSSVGVTVSALLDFRNMERVLNEEEAAALGKHLSPWATHMLYDFAAQEARRLLVSIGQPPDMVPSATPPLV